MLPGRSPSPNRRNQESHQHHSKFAQIKEVVNGKGTAFLKKKNNKINDFDIPRLLLQIAIIRDDE